MLKKKITKRLTLLLLLTMLLSLFLSGCGKKDPEPEVIEEPDAEPEVIEEADQEPEEETEVKNALTGLPANDEAINRRIVAVMVENSEDARPQWGMDDENYSPDIIVEAEVEYGITRTMWLFSDYTKVPEIIGPVRSARPPYVRFSELFDSIYVHWGGSGTTSDYLGADYYIQEDGVNNINQMAFYGSTTLFGRATDRNVALEHTGILYGDNLSQVIDEYGYRQEIDWEKCSKLQFNEEPVPLSDRVCNKLTCLISGRSWYKNWTYSEEDSLYHTSDFKNDLTRDNLLVLLDNTQYILKASSGTVYCNYDLSGGPGKLASRGTAIDITWTVEDGKLVIRNEAGEIVKLNPGKTWIGYGSANNGGYVEIE